MGTPTDAWDPDFRVSRSKGMMDCREGEEEFSPGTPKTEQRETLRADKEENGPEGIPEPRGEHPNESRDSEVYTS
ncbi:hypothetical protein NDU88_006572 [Pleurodeles waltl]|uniref:Uncharacterized protein n=1 Tax=Pleurodeles waltl TaxID=8319 RepID=A0AAV7TYS3_PLEWA|nr:hypothetical protein NDU88_006572 [Pleurodeles waltl]